MRLQAESVLEVEGEFACLDPLGLVVHHLAFVQRGLIGNIVFAVIEFVFLNFHQVEAVDLDDELLAADGELDLQLAFGHQWVPPLAGCWDLGFF